jgi:hypothetical protein
MRGDGDKPMSKTSNVELLQKIIADQRAIIQTVTGKPAEATPQSWALYKEVQEYYDKGMRVPDDITLLLCDDNWGNVRKLPIAGQPPRPGGYGLYYHEEYVGAPRNYKWINTNQISRIWEELHLAKANGVDHIWIVNVGDIKPLEYPTQFFLDYAWDPEAIPANRIPDYARRWASDQFGPAHAADIADILGQYTRFNARRKPELITPNTYSLTHYHEWETVVDDYNRLADKAKAIGHQLPAEYQDAYFELVLYPVLACANLNELYFALAQNRRQDARDLFDKDSLLSLTYNRDIAHGKWPHMMDQTHIGYTRWQEPPRNTLLAFNPINPDTTTSLTTYRPNSPAPTPPASFKGFIETDGYISIEAEHYTNAIENTGITWQTIPDYGRTLSGMQAMPVTAPPLTPEKNSPHLEYEVYLTDTGTIRVQAYCSPILEFHNTPIHYAIAFDDETPQLVDLGKNKWDQMVSDNITIKTTEHHITQPGPHVLKFYFVDPGPVLQKLIIDAGGAQPCYLGPPESPHFDQR